MKIHERELRSERERAMPFTIVTTSGDRIKVRSADHIFLPPLEDENGRVLTDEGRSEFFEVWSDGRSKRLVAFATISVIETQQ